MTPDRERVAIVDGLRTPFAKRQTTYAELTALDLATVVVAELVDRAPVAADMIEQVVFGQVVLDVEVPNIAREIVLRTRLDPSIDAHSVTKACITSYQTTVDVARAIEVGAISCGIAGGADSASAVPLVVDDDLEAALKRAEAADSLVDRVKAFSGIRPGALVPSAPDLTEPSTGETMGEGAERMAKTNHISRLDQDDFAHRSHVLAARAWNEGRFADDVMDVAIPPSFDDSIDTDNLVRFESDRRDYDDLHPVFDRDHGTITAANSSPLTDGASALVLMAGSLVDELGVEPLGWITSSAFTAVDPAAQLLIGPVRLRDIDRDATRRALASIDDVLHARHVPPDERRRSLARITTTTGTAGFGDVDVCIEAVVEDADIKATVYGEIEPVLSDDAILATNTSSIPLSTLAEHVARPDRFVGMHYFSPVGRVPLLEVIRGSDTSDRAIAVAGAVGRAQGKTVIVVNDGPGFYTSRILARYLGEAARIANEGIDPKVIDEEMEAVGFPVGPFQLLDEVGIDVGHEIADVLHRHLGDRFEPAPLLDALAADDRTGRKNGRGVYRYETDGGETKRIDEIDPRVLAMLQVVPTEATDADRTAIRERCLLAFVTEAARCLDEAILDGARDGDVGAVFGLGFPAELGGPFRYIDRRGAADIVAACDRFATFHGARWDPPDVLRLANTGTTFRDDHAQTERKPSDART